MPDAAMDGRTPRCYSDSCIDAFSEREPDSTSLENALVT